MKKIQFVVMLAIMTFSNSTLIGQEVDSYEYGNWYYCSSRNGWPDTRSDDFDLVIHKSDSVYFKQNLFINPCRFEFEGKYRNDTIFHSSSLFCLNYQASKMEFQEVTIDTFLILEASLNKLKIVNVRTNEVSNYQKKVEYSNLVKLIKSQKWTNNVKRFYVNSIALETYTNSSRSIISDSTKSLWNFNDHNELIIDYGKYQTKWHWELSRDSFLFLTPENAVDKSVKFKADQIQPWLLTLFSERSLSLKPNIDYLIGYYVSDHAKPVTIVLKEDYSYSFRKNLQPEDGEELTQIGSFDIEGDIVTFTPITYDIARINPRTGSRSTVKKFARSKQIFSLKLHSEEGRYYFECQNNKGDTFLLYKKIK